MLISTKFLNTRKTILFSYGMAHVQRLNKLSGSYLLIYMEVQMNKLLLPLIMLFTLQNLFLIHCKGGMS